MAAHGPHLLGTVQVAASRDKHMNIAMTGVCGRCAFCGLAGCVPAANDRSIVLFCARRE